MWNTFKYTILSILRERSVVIWAILFPLILATLFNAMFGGIEENAHTLDPIRVAIMPTACTKRRVWPRQTAENGYATVI